MESATVTFVVPCYRLAHYLEECVESILAQSHRDIEVLILDDRSPDDTAEVARRIQAAHTDRRITYVLNPENLGNIRNYNKGIGLAAGKYVWILSPDDRLRSRQVVERYVRTMEARPDVGYAFCAAHLIRESEDAGIYAPSRYRPEDAILDGPRFARDILDNCFELVAASVMIRKECYEQVTLFPTDLPHRGDSYVWALIAMRYAVAYFAEPMVDYRVHPASMMSTLARENMARAVEDDIAVPWRVKAEAERLGATEIVEHCRAAIVFAYRNALLGLRCRGHPFRLAVEEVEASLARWEPDPEVRASFRKRLAERMYLAFFAELRRARPRRAGGALASSFALDPGLRFRPPIGRMLGRLARLGTP